MTEILFTGYKASVEIYIFVQFLFHKCCTNTSCYLTVQITWKGVWSKVKRGGGFNVKSIALDH